MKILVVHNYYRLSGGEDTVVEREVNLLRRFGQEVETYFRNNSEMDDWSLGRKALLPLESTWSGSASREIENRIQSFRPDIVHFHNTQFLVSQSAYHVCRKLGVPVIQTLHNPRLLCPAGTCVYQGQTCEDCKGRRLAIPGIVRGCYRNSRITTAMVAATQMVHGLLRSGSLVSRYICSTETYRQKFIEAGLPPSSLAVKPHFVDPDPLPSSVCKAGAYALYVGRLEDVKGVPTLLEAWRNHLGDLPLVLRGVGPLEERVQAQLPYLKNATLLKDRMTTEQLNSLMAEAKLLVWPSHGLYETFGLVAAEALCCGTPVIGSDTGVAQEMIADGENGLLFRAGDPEDLARKVRWAWNNPGWLQSASEAARKTFEARFTAHKNYQQLLTIYQSAA